jgi:hypothetical protein
MVGDGLERAGCLHGPLSTLKEKDPELLEAWFTFSERFVTAIGLARGLRLVVPGQDQEPPETA